MTQNPPTASSSA